MLYYLCNSKTREKDLPVEPIAVLRYVIVHDSINLSKEALSISLIASGVCILESCEANMQLIETFAYALNSIGKPLGQLTTLEELKADKATMKKMLVLVHQFHRFRRPNLNQYLTESEMIEYLSRTPLTV
jgi:hypothetical protein